MRLMTAVAGLMCLSLVQVSAIDYEVELKPLLRKRCFSCHGALRQEAGLRLDTVEAMLSGGESGGVIVRHDAAASLIIDRISAQTPEKRMPPEHEAEPFSKAQIKLLSQWISAGAVAPENERPDEDPREHWAFRPIVQPTVPEVIDTEWSLSPIDAFISAHHEKSGIQPQPTADNRQLLRRLTFDLIGLPPTPEQVASLDTELPPDWYQQTVDQLLADPRHGERWARHWMDIWRYSDWWGLNAQLRRSQPHIWHWRDWIVESINENKPYDEMIREMLAADELFPNDPGRLRATGYLARNFNLFNRQTWMDETVEHVGKSLLGLTFNCAKCHDHKFDPVDQVDYYRMKAFFEPYMTRLDMVPGEPNVNTDGIPCIFDALPDAPTYRLERGQENRPDRSTLITPGVPTFLSITDIEINPVELPPAAWQTARRPWVLETYLAEARGSLEQARQRELQLNKKARESSEKPGDSSPAELLVAEQGTKAAEAELHSREARAAAMRAKWNTDAKNAEAPKSDHTAIQAERNSAVAKARHAVALAEYESQTATDQTRAAAQKKLDTSRKQLEASTAQAIAPIAETDTFTPLEGTKWTPTRFMFSGKDDTHPGFPSHSTGRRTALARWVTDSSNPLTARVAVNHIWTRHMGQPLVPSVFDFGRNGSPATHPELLDWLAAELVQSGWDMQHLHQLMLTSRTYQLSSSAEDNTQAADHDPDNRLWWRRTPARLESQAVRDSVLAHAGTMDETRGGPTVASKDQATSRRRSLYFFHSNNDRNLMLTTFDEASVNECYRRETSIVPQQALALSNGRLVRESATLIAQRLRNIQSGTDSDYAERAFAVLLGMRPNAEELACCLEAMDTWRQHSDTSDGDPMMLLIWSLMNHNDFVTVR